MALAHIVATKIEITPNFENTFSNRIKKTKSNTVATFDVENIFPKF